MNGVVVYPNPNNLNSWEIMKSEVFNALPKEQQQQLRQPAQTPTGEKYGVN